MIMVKAGLMMHGHGKQILMMQVKKMKIKILMTGSNPALFQHLINLESL